MPYLFFIVAVLYAMVGFGGGSSYIAFLALFDFPYQVIPPVALVCNIIVVTGGTYHFIRQRHFRWSLFWPFMVGSVPMAFMGGRLPISREAFLLLLGATLLVAGLRLLLMHRRDDFTETRTLRTVWAVLAGAGLGLLAGVVGIGGGIFLAPLMLNLRWALPKRVAATCSVFILVNSLAGLAGQLLKPGCELDIADYWPLFLAVLIGGQIGSRLGSGPLAQRWVRTLTGVLVTFVAVRVLIRWFLPY